MMMVFVEEVKGRIVYSKTKKCRRNGETEPQASVTRFFSFTVTFRSEEATYLCVHDEVTRLNCSDGVRLRTIG